MTKELFETYCKKCNVYRTKRFIIVQRIGIVQNEKLGNFTLSVDYHFRRTPELDAMYDERFAGRTYPEGWRLRADERAVKDMD